MITGELIFNIVFTFHVHEYTNCLHLHMSLLFGFIIYTMLRSTCCSYSINEQLGYRRVKLLGVALYYIIYRSRDPNLCRAKDNANHWKVTVLEEFLHTVLLYQTVTVKNINVLAVF